jgi:hypothetical protein
MDHTIHTACLGGLESLGGSQAGGNFKSGIREASLGDKLSSGSSSMILISRPLVCCCWMMELRLWMMHDVGKTSFAVNRSDPSFVVNIDFLLMT